MQTPPVKPPLDAPPHAPKLVCRGQGYGRVLVPSVKLYMASGATIGPLVPPPRLADDWRTSMLQLQVAEILGIALDFVRFIDMSSHEFVSNDQCVTNDTLLVVVSRTSS